MLINYPFIKNEIHLEIGGDHGGASFKMSFQVANVVNPNRKDSTVVFSIFLAKDYRVNIKLALEFFKIQMKGLQESTCQQVIIFWHRSSKISMKANDSF